MAGFTDVVRALCAHLGITKLAAVVGIAGGGPSAVTMAARHPDLVERLILQSAVGWVPWPQRHIRIGAHLALAAGTERATWALLRVLLRVAPDLGLRLLLRALSTLPVRQVVAALRPQDRTTLLALYQHMRSGHGFLNDLRATPDVSADVRQPTLIVATRHDRGVPFTHAEAFAATIPHATLVESVADSHLIWFGPDWPAIADQIQSFLTTDV